MQRRRDAKEGEEIPHKSLLFAKKFERNSLQCSLPLTRRRAKKCTKTSLKLWFMKAWAGKPNVVNLRK